MDIYDQIADVINPILRADFVYHFGLLITLVTCQLIDAETNIKLNAFK